MAIKKISANLLGSNAVLAANIAGGAISAADIADNSITAAKISASTSPTLGGLTLGTTSSGANISLKNSDYGNTGLARFYGTDGNEKLQIGANANTQAVMYTFSGVSLDFQIGTNANTLHLKSTGEVGIGKNNPAFALDIDAVSSSVQIQIGRTTTNTGSTWMGTDGSGFYLGVGAYGSGNSAGDPNGFTVDTSGNVGIGGNTTTASGLKNLSLGAYSDTSSGIVLRATTASALNFEDSSSVTAARVYYNHTDGYMSFNTEQAERMRITSVGDVAIGGVTPQGLSGSARELTIGTTGDTANDGGGVAFTHNSVLGSYVLGQKQAMTIAHYIDGSPIYFRTNSGGTHGTRMTITSGGNIEMGSATAATAYFSIDKSTSGENGILFRNAGSNKIKLIQSAAEELEVYVNNTTLALVIAESGIADFGTTGALRIPRGTTAQRPTGAAGHIRYNTTTENYEVYDYGASQWVNLKTDPSISFVNPTTYFTTRFAISADGQSADADNSSGYGVVSTNINLEGNFTLITKWAHDYMGIGIAYKAGITNSNFTGESNDTNGPYGGNSGVDGFDSTVSYMGQYHWPVNGGGNDDHQTTWYIKHQRSGNTISTHYSTNSNSADDPAHSSWTQVQSATISTSDHCKPVWGEASSNENQILTFTYKDVTGGYNFS